MNKAIAVETICRAILGIKENATNTIFSYGLEGGTVCDDLAGLLVQMGVNESIVDSFLQEHMLDALDPNEYADQWIDDCVASVK